MQGQALIRTELCQEAIRLGRLLVELLPDETEARAATGLTREYSRAQHPFTGDVAPTSPVGSRWAHTEPAKIAVAVGVRTRAGTTCAAK